MAIINRNTFGGDRKPALKPDHVAGDATVVTIRRADAPKVGGGTRVVLEFDEYPDHAFWLNQTKLDYVMSKLGNDTDKWIGQRVPLEKIMVNNPQSGEDTECLYVAPPQEWDSMFSEFDGVKKPAAKKAAAKRGGK